MESHGAVAALPDVAAALDPDRPAAQPSDVGSGNNRDTVAVSDGNTGVAVSGDAKGATDNGSMVQSNGSGNGTVVEKGHGDDANGTVPIVDGSINGTIVSAVGSCNGDVEEAAGRATGGGEDECEDEDGERPGDAGRATRRQLLLALLSNLTAFGASLSMGFSAVALPPMREPDAAPHVTADEASWIASVAAIATPLGCLLSGPMLDRLGRRMMLLLVNVPCGLGWLVLAATPQADAPGPASAAFLAQLYAGRALTGFATGLAATPATVYAAEIAQPKLRGLLVTWTSVAIALGVLVVYLLGWAMPEAWRGVALCCLAAPAGAGLLTLLLPESPAWLAARGRPAAAETALRRARAVPPAAPTPAALRSELSAACRAAEAKRREEAARGEHGLRRALRELRAPAVIKPLLILNTFFFFQQLSGVFVVIFYAVDVANEAGVTIDPHVASVLIGAARVAVTIATGFVSQRFGRRPPALVSGAGMALGATTLAVWLRLAPASPAAPGAGWLPVAALLLYIAASTLGFLTLPWAMLGELFPASARGLAAGLTSCMAYIFSFFMLKLYPSMTESMGSWGLFAFFAAAALAGTVFVALCLPETRGRSLQEIEDMFAGRTKKMDDAALTEGTADAEVKTGPPPDPETTRKSNGVESVEARLLVSE